MCTYQHTHSHYELCSEQTTRWRCKPIEGESCSSHLSQFLDFRKLAFFSLESEERMLRLLVLPSFRKGLVSLRLSLTFSPLRACDCRPGCRFHCFSVTVDLPSPSPLTLVSFSPSSFLPCLFLPYLSLPLFLPPWKKMFHFGVFLFSLLFSVLSFERRFSFNPSF